MVRPPGAKAASWWSIIKQRPSGEANSPSNRVNALHPIKGAVMEVTLLGMVMAFSDVHRINAPECKLVRLLGSVTSVSEGQFNKAFAPMYSTPSGIMMLFSVSLQEKASSQMYVSLPSNTIIPLPFE